MALPKVNMVVVGSGAGGAVVAKQLSEAGQAGACFPTIGGFNPSLTIQANAYRVSAFIMKEWKGGAFRTPV